MRADESGNFTGYQPGSIDVVGALAIPDANMPLLRKKYARIRNAAQINRVVRLTRAATRSSR
jgi:hypothetical protein